MEILEKTTTDDGDICIFAQDEEGNLYHDLIFPATLSDEDLELAINTKIEEIQSLTHKNS
jgi:hypothetical protein